MRHDELARDLAGHLRADRRMVWCDVQLGPAGSPRPDVYAIFKSYANPKPMAYECKVSVSDFRSDVTAGKWMTYLSYACGVIFAVEAGLGIGRDHVPAHCGLIVRGETGWRAVKKPTLSPVTIPQDALLKLLIDGVEREGPRHRAASWDGATKAVRKAVGEDAARYVGDIDRARRDLEYTRSQGERIVEAAHQEAARIREEAAATNVARAELVAFLGLPAHAGKWEIERAIDRLRAESKEHPAQSQLVRLTAVLQNAIGRYGAKPETEEPAA